MFHGSEVQHPDSTNAAYSIHEDFSAQEAVLHLTAPPEDWRAQGRAVELGNVGCSDVPADAVVGVVAESSRGGRIHAAPSPRTVENDSHIQHRSVPQFAEEVHLRQGEIRKDCGRADREVAPGTALVIAERSHCTTAAASDES